MATWSQMTLGPLEQELRAVQARLDKNPNDASAKLILQAIQKEIARRVAERARDLEGL